MRALLAIASLALISATPPPSEPPPKPHTLARLIECPINAHQMIMGSGFYIGPDVLLTAAHVAAGYECYVDGEPTKLLYVNTKQDIAVLQTESRVSRWLPLDCGKPRKGRIVSVYGYPRGERLELRVFLATGKFVPESDAEFAGMAVFSGAATAGQSGSAILYNGRVIGVLDAGSQSEMLGRLIHGTYLCGRLR